MDVELQLSGRGIDGLHRSTRIQGRQASGMVRDIPAGQHAPSQGPSQLIASKKQNANKSAQRKDDVKLPTDVNKRNLFVKLGLFFSEPEDNQTVVECLLEDQLNRGLVSIDRLISDLEEYCSQFNGVPNNNCRSFLRSSFVTITWCGSGDNANVRMRDAAGRMNYLLEHHAHALSVLLGLICKPEFCPFALFIDAFRDAFKPKANVSAVQSQRVLSNLQALLEVCTQLKIRRSDGVKFVDMTLGFGETPLIAATRARRADTIAMLLRFGANTNASWLSFQNCLEVALFSPNMVHIDENQLSNIKECLQQILKSTKFINMKRLKELSKDYYPITDKWVELLCTFGCSDGPPSLKHTCRVHIREALSANWSLPSGVHDLPLPKPIKRYLDLTVS